VTDSKPQKRRQRLGNRRTHKLSPTAIAAQSAWRLFRIIRVPVATLFAAAIELQVSPCRTVYVLPEIHVAGGKAVVFTYSLLPVMFFGEGCTPRG
jgi:hypothetical protein